MQTGGLQQLHELGWHDRWLEKQLSHADRNKVRRFCNLGAKLSSFSRIWSAIFISRLMSEARTWMLTGPS
jgi:hypothetical protein